MGSARSRGRVTALALGGAFLLAALAVLILWATAPRESADDAAQEYLDAIAAGDIERANELVPAVPDLGSPPTADGRTTAATAGWTPISDPQVVDSLELVEGIQVDVSYVVGDATHTAALRVVPEEDTLDAVPTSDGATTRIRVVPEFTSAMTEELIEQVRTALGTCTSLDDGYVSQCGMLANQDVDGITFDPVVWTVVDGPVISEDSQTGLAVLRTTLRAEYEVADDFDGPRTPVTEEIVLRTRLMLTYESADSYQIMDIDWHTMPSDS